MTQFSAEWCKLSAKLPVGTLRVTTLPHLEFVLWDAIYLLTDLVNATAR